MMELTGMTGMAKKQLVNFSYSPFFLEENDCALN